MDYKVIILVLLAGLMAGFVLGSDGKVTGLVTGGGGTHVRTEIPADVAFVDSSGILIKNIDSSPAVAAEARKVDTKAGVVISGSSITTGSLSGGSITTSSLSTDTLKGNTIKGEWWVYAPGFYSTYDYNIWQNNAWRKVIATSSSGVNVETFGGSITTSGGKIDTKGGELTTGKVTTTGDISIGGKINMGTPTATKAVLDTSGSSTVYAMNRNVIQGGMGIKGESEAPSGIGVSGKGSIGVYGSGSAWGLYTPDNSYIGGTLQLNSLNGALIGSNLRLASGSWDNKWLRVLNSDGSDYFGVSRDGGLAASNLWAKNDIYLGSTGKWLSEYHGSASVTIKATCDISGSGTCTIKCPSGTIITGGGWKGTTDMKTSRPEGNGWYCEGGVWWDPSSITTCYAVCLSVPGIPQERITVQTIT